MRSSVILGSLCAALAVASPINRALEQIHRALEKKALTTQVSTKVIWVTVTEGELPATSSEAPKIVTIHTTRTHYHSKSQSASVAPVSTSVVVAPVPTTTSTSISIPPPAPSTTSTTPPAVTTTSAPVVVQAPVTVESSSAVAVVKAVSTTAAAAVASPTDYQSTALYHHAMHRANHSAAALTWDDTLAKYALATANTCVFAHDMYQGGGGYGQNLAAYGTSGDVSKLDKSTLVADAITNQWYYGEAAAVPYGVASPDFSGPEFLHFTALVWKASTKVGCATVQCAAGTIFSISSLYTVCDYSAEGNVIGAFATNVIKPVGTTPISAVIS